MGVSCFLSSFRVLSVAALALGVAATAAPPNLVVIVADADLAARHDRWAADVGVLPWDEVQRRRREKP